MSDVGRSGGDRDAMSSGDVWRYVWLFALGTLLLCALAATVDNGFVILLAGYLVVAAAVAVGYAIRRRRS